VMRMQAASLTEDDIGFMIGPRINAASRMDAPEDAFRLLVARNDADAGTYARHLDRVNNERKGAVGAMVKDVKKKLARRSAIDPVIVIGDPLWRPALAGLAANTLMEEYSRPVFLWGRDGRGIIKGSCRSKDISVVELMRSAHDTFVDFGGHHASGGFSVKEDRIHEFPKALNDAHALLASAPSALAVAGIDAALSLDEVTPELVRTLSRFAPFGIGNEKPLFLFRGVRPSKVELFGKEKGHTKIHFARERGMLAAIGFFKKPEEFTASLVTDSPIDLVAHVEESSFGGRREIRLRIEDALPQGSL
jgi:single-stranded-DNA-specific exonuclease